MKLILRTSVNHLGEPGDLVEVKRGFARNYLLPKGLAIQATPANLRSIGGELDKLRAAAAAKREQARKIAAKLAKLLLTMERKVADIETGALYGSVSVTDVGDALGEHGYDFPRGDIHLDHPYKQLGEFDVTISLAHGVKGTVKVKVVGEDGETGPVVLAEPPKPAAVEEEEPSEEDVEAAEAEAFSDEDAL